MDRFFIYITHAITTFYIYNKIKYINFLKEHIDID